jgi:hypothetical protein
MSFLNLVKNALTPSRGEVALGFRGLAGGSILFAVFTLIGSGIALFINLIGASTLPGEEFLNNGSVLGAGFVAALAAAAMRTSIETGSSSLIEFISILGAVPITAALMFMAVRSATKALVNKGQIQNLRSLVIFSILLASGFIISAWLVAFALNNTYVIGFGTTSSMELAGWFVSASFISIVSLWAGYAELEESRADFEQGIGSWLGSIFKFFLASWLSLLTLVLVVFLTFKLIEPDFKVATNPLPLGSGVAVEGGLTQILVALAGVFALTLVLPLLIFYFFALSMGGELQVSDGGTGAFSVVVEFLETLGIPNYLASGFGLTTLSPIIGFVTLLLVFFVAVLSAAAATRQTGYRLRSVSDFLLIAGFVGIVLFFLQRFFTYGASTTNKGLLPQDAEAGDLILIEQSVTLGISNTSLALIALILILGFYLGSSVWNQVVDQGLNPVLRALAGDSNEPVGTSLKSQILASSVTSVVVLSALVPISIATTERIWAATDGPEQSASKLIKSYAEGEIADLKKETGFSSATWLPDEILDQARKFEMDSSETLTLNNLEERWKVGDIVTNTTHQIALGDRSFTLSIDNNAVVEEFWEITHPEFAPLLLPSTIEFQAPSSLQRIKDFNFSVNGKEASYSSFLAIPGSYRVKSSGYGLVAALDHEFLVSSGETLKVDLSSYLAIPDAALAEFSTSIKEAQGLCGDIDDLSVLDCPKYEDLEKMLTPTKESTLTGGLAYFELSPRTLAGAGVDVTESNKSFVLSCTPVVTTVTILSEGNLPKGVKKDFNTSISESDCTYKYSVKRTYKDSLASYPLELSGEAKYRFYTVGTLNTESKTISSSGFKFEQLTFSRR